MTIDSEEKVINKCLEIIESSHNSVNIIDALETKCNGLNVIEAFYVYAAMDNYYNDTHVFLDTQDETPIEIVKTLKALTEGNVDHVMYKEVKCFDRSVDKEHSTTKCLLKNIINGNAKEVVKYMLNLDGRSSNANISYKSIKNTLGNSRIVYDDFKHVLTASKDIIVLYERIE